MKLAVIAAGARTALGASLEETCASLATSVRRARPASYVSDEGDVAPVAAVLATEPTIPTGARLELLWRAALADLRDQLEKPVGRLGVLLLIDELGPSGWDPAPGHAGLLSELALADAERLTSAEHGIGIAAAALRATLTPTHQLVLTGDAADCVSALELAAQWLDEGAVDQVLLGGVSALTDRASLALSDGMEWLPGRARDDGASPGEACAALLLGREAPRGTVTIERAAHALATDADPARALTDAIETVLTGVDAAPARVVTDSAGLAAQAEERVVAGMRTWGRRGWNPVVEEPCLFLGELGAAAGPMLVAWCVERDAQGTTLVALSSGKQGGRAALLLQRISP